LLLVFDDFFTHKLNISFLIKICIY
jgi:hypothetical protein